MIPECPKDEPYSNVGISRISKGLSHMGNAEGPEPAPLCGRSCTPWGHRSIPCLLSGSPREGNKGKFGLKVHLGGQGVSASISHRARTSPSGDRRFPQLPAEREEPGRGQKQTPWKASSGQVRADGGSGDGVQQNQTKETTGSGTMLSEPRPLGPPERGEGAAPDVSVWHPEG